jgi:drug/metabolite transporter (DMT)-like permease
VSAAVAPGTASLAAVAMILASALAHALVNAIWKSGGDLLVRRAVLDASSAVMVLPLVFFVPFPGPTVWLFILGSACVHVPYLLMLTSAYGRGDLGLVYPIARGAGPAMSAALAVLFLGEQLSPLAVGGLALACAGVVGAASTSPPRDGLAAIGLALAVGACIGVYTAIDAAGVRSAETALSYIVWFFIAHAPCLGLPAIIRRGRGVFAAARAEWRSGLVAGALSVVSYGLALAAFRIAPVTELAALRETSVIFAALIGWIAMGEPMGRRRIAAAAVMAVGLIVLRWG